MEYLFHFEYKVKNLLHFDLSAQVTQNEEREINYLCQNYFMKQVSLAAIEKAIEVVDNLTDEQLENITERYADAQEA